MDAVYVHLTILCICTVDASVYFKTEYLAPDVKVVSFVLSSSASTLTYVVYVCWNISLAKGHFRSKMSLTNVVHVCWDILLAKGHLWSRAEHI